MIHNLIISIILIFISKSNSKFTQLDFLKINNSLIKNNYGNGNCVYLRGTNIGNLFVQENWMSSTNAKDQKTINEILTNRFGKETKEKLIKYYENNYFTLQDLDKIKEIGMSVIRVPFTYMNLYDKENNEYKLKKNAFEKLDWIVEETSKRGIYIILDLHGAFGSQNGQDHSGELIENVKDVTFYSNDELKNLTLKLWREVAFHYKNNPAVAGYDILNEPGEKAGMTFSYHWDFYNEIYKVIRSIDNDHIIIMESCWTFLNLPNPKKYNWENVMYEFHNYIWPFEKSSLLQIIANKLIIQTIKFAQFNVPIFIGEFTFFEQHDAWKQILELFNLNGYHYTSWSYKTNNMGSWGIYNQKGKEKIILENSTLKEIENIWSYNNIGTGNKSSNDMVYNRMIESMPGTVYFLNKNIQDKDYVSFKSAVIEKFVSADNFGESNLIANKNSIGNLAQFIIYNNNDGTVSIQARANNKFLSIIHDSNNNKTLINAKINSIQDCGKFYIEKLKDNKVALQSYINHKYIQVNPYDKKLYVLNEKIDSWEEFYMV